MAVTIKDIAKATGKSFATVSKALNGKTDVSKKTRDLILSTSESMEYIPNSIARSLVLKRSNIIGLIIPDIKNPFFSDVFASVSNYALTKGYNVIVNNTDWNASVENDCLSLLCSARVDGIIIKNCSDDGSYDKYSNIDVPIVFLSHSSIPDVPLPYSCVDYDDELGGFLATEHIIACGYKRIAYIGGEKDAYSYINRLKGYKKALAFYGIDYNPSYIFNSSSHIESGIAFGKKILSYSCPPDAVFCGNDIIALGVTQAAIEAGINIPEDFGVVGYDNISYSSLPQIQLTTIGQPNFNIAKTAVSVLVNEIANYPNTKKQKCVLQPHLVERKTTRKKNGSAVFINNFY